MTANEIRERMGALRTAIAGQASAQTYLQGAYNEACKVGDGMAAQAARNGLHESLDLVLDSIGEIYGLSRELNKL